MPTATTQGKKKELKRADVSGLQLKYEDLCWDCAVKLPDFQTTEDLEPLELGALIGQQRAEVALEMALKMPDHVYVSGLTHIHKSFVARVRQIVNTFPSRELQDVVCLHNFIDPDRPVFVFLSKGEGVKFKCYVEGLIEKLKEKIPERLLSRDFQDLEDRISEKINKESEFSKVSSEIRKGYVQTEKLGTLYYDVVTHQNGSHSIIPFILDEDGRKIFFGDIEKPDVSPDEMRRINEKGSHYFHELSEAIARDNYQYPLKAAEEKKRKDELKKERVDSLVQEETKEILRLYGDNPGVFDFVDRLRIYALDHINIFMPQIEGVPGFAGNVIPIPMVRVSVNDPFLPFRVNVAVDNSDAEGIPIIIDRNPTPARIFGRIVKRGVDGLNEDHTRVKLGALSRAKNGILIMPAREALSNGVLGRLYAVLQSKKLDVGETSDISGYFSSNIQPSPLEVNCKVILVGDMEIFHYLSHHEMTSSLFQTVVEFDRATDQTNEVVAQQVRLMASFCKDGNLPPFNQRAARKILEYGARLAGSKDMFSLDMREIKRLMEESAYWMQHDNSDTADTVEERHVKEALEKRVYIAGGMRDLIYKMIKDGILIIDIEGKRVGEVNGLAVFTTNTLRFSAPFKMTAETYGGNGGISNIESQAGLAGKIFQKSSYIVNARLHSKYADKNSDLGFAASMAMEQSYEPLEGDSATLAQYYAVVSDLSGIPLRQNIAVTGSMNQKGRVQPIGGQNEKIEGFFDVCKMLGYIKDARLEKEEDIPGVIVPRRNLRNLILRDDVLEAVREGRFLIYGVDEVEEGLEILTGVKAGELYQNKMYLVGTINYLVTKRLKELKEGSSEQNKAKKH